MTIGIYKLNVSSRLESVEDFSISERNKELIVDFVDYCFSEGLGEHRILKYITTLKYIALSLQIGFKDATDRDIRRYVSSLEKSDFSQWTKNDYKVVLKKFYRWLNCDEASSIDATFFSLMRIIKYILYIYPNEYFYVFEIRLIYINE